MHQLNLQLDGEEIFCLASAAADRKEYPQAIHLLKQVLQLDADHSKALYLLGVLHAQIGLYARAKQEITRAIGLNPELYGAVFQLGLLYYFEGNLDQALSTWAPLEKLGENSFFYHFRHGLHLIGLDQMKEGLQALAHGISLNPDNGALNHDVRMVIEKLTHLAENPQPYFDPDPAIEKSTQENNTAVNKVYVLNAYKNNE